MNRKLYKVTYETIGQIKREKYVLSESKEKAIILTNPDGPTFSVYKITIIDLCNESEIVNIIEPLVINFKGI